MKKYTFTFKNSFLDTLRNFLLGISFFCFSFSIVLFFTEKAFYAYYTSEELQRQTAMNLPIYQKSDYRSWDHKPNATGILGNTSIKINSQGLRNKEVLKNKTKKRILMLGDSFIFGMGVNAEETLPAYLQKFTGTKYHEIINAGVIGQTIDDALLYLKYEGIKMHPDYIIFNTFVGNDITELKRHIWEKDEHGKLKKVTDTLVEVNEENKLVLRESQKPVSYFLYWIEENIQILRSKHLGEVYDPTLTWPVFLPLDHKDNDTEILNYWIQYAEFLQQMKEFCDEQNIPLIVTILPMDTQVNFAYTKKYPGTPFNEEAYEALRPQNHIKILTKNLDIPTFDLLPALQHEENTNNHRLYFENDPHFSKTGNRFSAAYLYQFLVQEIL
jgi:lysophospholipase L1-like esterase